MNCNKIDIDELWMRRIKEDFLDFQKKDIHTDITLACSDGAIRAHKLVLASFSTLLANILKDLDTEAFIFFSELSISDVSFFIKAVYSGKLPGTAMGIQGVMIVYQAISHIATDCKKETPKVMPDDIQRGSSISKADPSKMDSQDANEIKRTVDEISDPKARLKSLAISMTKEERLIKSAANLEKLCKFCLEPVINHRVSLKVKQERNNSYHLKNQYVCCACGVVLGAPSNFVAHNNTEYSKCEASGQYPSLWQFNCNLCSKTICEHQSTSKTEQSFVCCHCQEEFASPGVLTIHLKTIQTLNLVECDICHIAIPATQLKKHKITKHGDIIEKLDAIKAVDEDTERGLEPCSECPKFVKASKKDKMTHYKDQHPEFYSILLKHNNEIWKSAPSSQYTFCDICNKEIRKCNMKDHKFHSHGMDLDNKAVDRPQFTCDICGHVSKYAKDVKKHKKFVHERILNYSCKFCGKKFSNKGNLNQHEVIHTGVTPFQCHVCGRQCRRKSELEKHIQTHVNFHPDATKDTIEPVMIKMDPHSTDSDPTTVTAIVSNQRMSSILNGIPQTHLPPIPVGVAGGSHHHNQRPEPGLHPGISRTDTGVHMIRDGHHTTVMSGGQQVPLIMTQMDHGTLRQADLLKDITEQHPNASSHTIKMPTFIIH